MNMVIILVSLVVLVYYTIRLYGYFKKRTQEKRNQESAAQPLQETQPLKAQQERVTHNSRVVVVPVPVGMGRHKDSTTERDIERDREADAYDEDTSYDEDEANLYDDYAPYEEEVEYFDEEFGELTEEEVGYEYMQYMEDDDY